MLSQYIQFYTLCSLIIVVKIFVCKLFSRLVILDKWKKLMIHISQCQSLVSFLLNQTYQNVTSFILKKNCTSWNLTTTLKSLSKQHETNDHDNIN